MAYGTPGGDGQPQTIVQVFLNIVVWGMDPQAAINAPRFNSKNFPDSFSPHNYHPGSIQLDSELAPIAPALRRMNFKVEVLKPMDITMGAACAIVKLDDGSLIGGADPREEAWVEGN
jgi:gamma-glutamyltranspeptidase/glutathione hydrolase